MSLFGSLYTAVSGLAAQSQATAIISNNIANVNTTGFKRAEATFAALVTTESANALYSPGSVVVNRVQEIDQQGQIAQTASGLDVAISGAGFFSVRSANTLDIEGDFLYTRNGQFHEDETGVLQNSAGLYLYGWPVDPLDSDPNTAQGVTVFNPDTSALVPVNVSLASGQSRVTTEGNLGINLDADESPTLLNPATNLVDYPNSPNFSRTLRMYDSLGSAQDVTFEFTKVYGPQAAVVSTTADYEVTDLLSSSGIIAGDSFTLSIGGGITDPFIATATSTISDILNFVNTYPAGTGSGIGQAFLNGNGEIVMSGISFDVADTVTFTDDGVNNPLSLLGITDGTYTPLGTLPGDNIPSPLPTDEAVFPQLVNGTGSAQYNARGWWQVNVVGPNPTTPLAQGLINFNADGSFNAATDADGKRDIELRNVDWLNGSALQSIDVNFSGFSQKSGLYNVSSANQNGEKLGLKTGVEIDSDGYVNARFSNGTISRLYKLPVVTFPSTTNLQEVSGTAYIESGESGTALLQEAGVAQAGDLASASIEQSNVDLADEFTKLIVTQRAYSANTKVINTVDQMTEDLLRLR